MATIRRVRASAAVVVVAIVLAGCVVPRGESAANEQAREQFAEMDEEFTANAPPAGTDDFVGYVYAGMLDEHGQRSIEENGDLDPTNLGIVDSGRLIYGVKVVDGYGVVSVIVMGYADGVGWVTESAVVYSCLTAAFDLERGGEPEYADAECINEFRGGIAGGTHKSVRELGG